MVCVFLPLRLCNLVQVVARPGVVPSLPRYGDTDSRPPGIVQSQFHLSYAVHFHISRDEVSLKSDVRLRGWQLDSHGGTKTTTMWPELVDTKHILILHGSEFTGGDSSRK